MNRDGGHNQLPMLYSKLRVKKISPFINGVVHQHKTQFSKINVHVLTFKCSVLKLGISNQFRINHVMYLYFCHSQQSQLSINYKNISLQLQWTLPYIQNKTFYAFIRLSCIAKLHIQSLTSALSAYMACQKSFFTPIAPLTANGPVIQ